MLTRALLIQMHGLVGGFHERFKTGVTAWIPDAADGEIFTGQRDFSAQERYLLFKLLLGDMAADHQKFVAADPVDLLL